MQWTSSRHIVSALFLFFFSISYTYAQSGTTTLRGTIADPQGSVVPNAEVNLFESRNRRKPYHFIRMETVRTNTAEVRPATYTLSVTAAGFAPYKTYQD